ncbi:polysaccharide deacetylase family protein [Anaerobacillus alkaliphilus]|nr:polysaccharide deacetylase family protein [Anaerobacillus alkaliphilus]
MNKQFTILVVGFLICLLLPLNSSFADESAIPEAEIIVDGRPQKTKYLMRSGHILVPAFFLKHTGVNVNRNQQYRSVVFSFEENLYALPINKNFSDDYLGKVKKWVRFPLVTNTVEIDGDVYVPLVDLAKKFGMIVTYNPKLRRTEITTNIRSAKSSIRRGNPERKFVALTFDDGPDPHYTPQILDILKEKNVRATFFVMGKQVENYPNIMKRIFNEGHAFGNHTWNHPSFPRVMTEQIIEEINSTQTVIDRTIGRRSDLFRPPYGAITKADALLLEKMGMRTIMWTVDTLDWSGLSGDDILSIVHRDISPGGIILQHNFEPHREDARLLDGTVEALPRIIDELRAKGYRFVTIHTLLAN